MQRKTKWVAGAAVAIAVIGGGAGVGIASGGDDDEAPISGGAPDPASEAALAHTGGGEVTGTEVGDEESYYEVEVTLDDGSQLDVQLDKSFEVVGDEADDDGAGADD
jgi:uncharacterized membrane protein YkoI